MAAVSEPALSPSFCVTPHDPTTAALQPSARLRAFCGARVERVRFAHVQHLLANVGQVAGIGAMMQGVADPVRDLPLSTSFIPRVVSAGVPMRMPLGFIEGWCRRG